MDNLNDGELWQRIQGDDRSAFEYLYRFYVEMIFTLVSKHIDNRYDAEDVTQDVFLTIWEQRKQIVLQKKIFSYLYSMARFKTFRYNRDKGRTEQYQLQWEYFQEHESGAVPEAFMRAEMLRLEANVSTEIEKLPPQMKKIYQLSIEEGVSISEIASQLIISEHTVKKHLVNIKKRIRTLAFRMF